MATVLRAGRRTAAFPDGVAGATRAQQCSRAAYDDMDRATPRTRSGAGSAVSDLRLLRRVLAVRAPRIGCLPAARPRTEAAAARRLPSLPRVRERASRPGLPAHRQARYLRHPPAQHGGGELDRRG